MHPDTKKTHQEMKLDIILSGVGGQGILSIAAIIGEASLRQGLNIKQAEVHGMSQRGGDVQSNLRISSEPIFSDLIARGTADAIISLEPMEALRYLPYLSAKGWVITNSAAFKNIPNYPNEQLLLAELSALENVILINVDQLSHDGGVARAANMVLLGAASLVLGIEYTELEQGIRNVFAAKGDAIIEMNLKALAIGRQAAIDKQ